MMRHMAGRVMLLADVPKVIFDRDRESADAPASMHMTVASACIVVNANEHGRVDGYISTESGPVPIPGPGYVVGSGVVKEPVPDRVEHQ